MPSLLGEAPGGKAFVREDVIQARLIMSGTVDGRKGLITFTTCSEYPSFSESDVFLAKALMERGFRVVPVVWNEDAAFLEESDLVLFRAHWDYHLFLEDFSRWLEELETKEIPLRNLPQLVRWNLTKEYLFDLARWGVPIPHTEILSPGDDVHECYRRRGWSRGVLKPLAGASGHLVESLGYDELEWWHHTLRQKNIQGVWLVQEFLPEIEGGEISLIFLNGRYSHGVLKKPRPGEFRTNGKFQAEIFRHEVSEKVLSQACRVFDYLPEVPLYARIDGVMSPRGEFRLLELELNEPSLYFQFAPEKAAGFARDIEAVVCPV